MQGSVFSRSWRESGYVISLAHGCNEGSSRSEGYRNYYAGQDTYSTKKPWK